MICPRCGHDLDAPTPARFTPGLRVRSKSLGRFGKVVTAGSSDAVVRFDTTVTGAVGSEVALPLTDLEHQ